MLGTIATLVVALTVGPAPAAAERDTQFVSAPRDTAVSFDPDSAVPLARRSAATVAFGSRVAVGRETPDSATAQRRRAVEHSDWYYRRLTIHKVASYATIPLFVTEYVLGDKLYKYEGTSTTRSAHQAVASGIGVLFGVNTITGVWNLWDDRHDEAGRARRTTHAILMLASDAGFVATAALGPGDEFEGGNNRTTHRNVAIASMSVSLASYLMMYLWK